ncbi:MAG: glycoside hydrolase family 2 protein [Ruminococcaceae bacterium]|nr:glycoside hydrolase family 2 protein [Oscillospiraceae bacterium]
MRYTKWNDGWKFWEEKDAFSLVWNVPENARDICLPHDAMMEVSPRPDSVNGGDTGFRDGGSYVYVKQFIADEAMGGEVIYLKFERIYMNALVYLNGQLVAQRPYGYSGFLAPLNDYLKIGEENELRVLVKNIGPNSRWYSGSGIIGNVWLLRGNALHISDSALKLSTAYIEEDYAAVDVSLELCNRDFRAHSFEISLKIYSGASELCAETSLPLSLGGSKTETIKQRMLVPSPKLWSAECPALYSCRCALTIGGETIDSSEASFGIRSLKMDAIGGLRVNGEKTLLRGACIHHDNGLLGAISTYSAELRRVKKLKEAGFNAIRCAHNSASSQLLRACDELGMYVMDEAFDMWTRPKKDNDYALHFTKWWKEDLESMVNNDFNHPCVIIYSLGNEVPEAGTAQGSAIGREMGSFVKSLDPNRYVTVSVNGVFASGDYVPQIMSDVISSAIERGEDVGNVNDFMTAMDTHMDEIVKHPLVSSRLDAAAVGCDLVGYNYMASRYEPDSIKYPHRVMVGSETYPPHIARNWALVKKLPAVIGDFTWTGWDYIGEAGVGVPAYSFGEGGFGAQFPCQLSYCGDIDITGFRRPLSYLRQIVFGLRKAPYIAVQNPAHRGDRLIKTPWVLSDSSSSWCHSGYEGESLVIEVYSAGDETELFLNGNSLGKKKAGEDCGFITYFEAEYAPGRLEAVSYEKGVEIGRYALESAGNAAEIRLEAEESPDDIRYITISLCDSEGRVCANACSEISIREENAQLLGFGSGDPKPPYTYKEKRCRLHNGRALAIVRCGEGAVLYVEGENGITAKIKL